MADGQRKYPVNKVVLHHAVSDPMVNWDDIDVQDWFDKTGAGRGYKGVARSYHQHPQRSKETFSQAHFCLHRYTKDNNPYGWRLTLLMKDPFDNVAWHAGNWEINQQSIGIETAGNWLNEELPEAACLLVADTFRAHDKSIGGALSFFFHSQFSATACPGRIKERIALIVDMVNNPSKYEYLKEDPKVIQQLQQENAQLRAEDAKEDLDFQNKINDMQATIISLASLKTQNETLTTENNELKVKIENLEKSVDEKIKLAVKDAVDQVTVIYQAKLAEKDLEITGLNEAMAKMRNDANTVMLPHENAFSKLEKIITGKFTWKEKLKMVGKDFLYIIQNTLGGLSVTGISVELMDQMLGVAGANYPVWVKAVVVTAIFIAGYNGTKSISKNVLTSNNYTVAKAVIEAKNPDLKDELEVIKYELDKNGVLK